MQKLTSPLSLKFWPAAEDRALRGRNPSAVFRTLYRQVGSSLKRLPSCAHTWRVEMQCDKSTPQMLQSRQQIHQRRLKTIPFHKHTAKLKKSKPLSVFSGQAQTAYGSRTLPTSLPCKAG